MLVSVDTLIAYMANMSLTPAQRTHAETVILPGVQQELETHCNRPLEKVHIRENRVADDRGYIVFTVTPVWKINFITRSDGSVMPLPDPLLPVDNVPAFVNMAGVRNVDKGGDPNQLGLTFEFYVGRYAESPYWPLTLPDLSGQPTYYVCDYIGGWDGFTEEGLALAILRVAAREAERQFDDTFSLRGGTQDAAEDSDSREKYWTQDELIEWDRLRRRVVV